MYACQYGDVGGVLELLVRNKLLLFTPADRRLYASHQVVISLTDVSGCESHLGEFLELTVGTDHRVRFRFESTEDLMELVRVLLEMRDLSPTSSQGSISHDGVTRIPACINDEPPPVVHTDSSFLLTVELAAELRPSLPLDSRFGEWRILFTPKLHGISMPSFFRRCAETPAPCVLVVTCSRRCCVFGAFCKRPFHSSRKYFGSSENFVFSSNRASHTNDPVHAVSIFGWTCANQLFQFADDRRLVIGGGPGGAAIVVYDNWLRGSCGLSDTFNPETRLCCSADFVVGDIEFWSLG